MLDNFVLSGRSFVIRTLAVGLVIDLHVCGFVVICFTVVARIVDTERQPKRCAANSDNEILLFFEPVLRRLFQVFMSAQARLGDCIPQAAQ